MRFWCTVMLLLATVLATVLAAAPAAAETPGATLTPLERHRQDRARGGSAPAVVQGWVTGVAPAGLVTSLAVATVEAQGLVDQMPVQFTVQGTPLRARLLSEATFRELAASADDLARLGVDVVGVLDEDGYVVIVGLYGDLGAAFGIRPGAPVVLQAR